MTRRGNPERIHQAQRAGILRRLVDAERGPVGPEVIGTDRGSSLYWDIAWDWIAERRRPPKVDTTSMNAEGHDGQVYGG